MPRTAADIAEMLQAQCLGSPSREITDVVTLANARPDSLTFYKDKKSLKGVESCQEGTILIASSWAEELQKRNSDCTWILVADPQSAFLEVIPEFVSVPDRSTIGISPTANIADSSSIGLETNIHAGATIEDDVVIGERCEISAGVVIGRGTIIGDDCLIYPNVVIYPGMEIQNRVTLHANCVIGADGFGYQQKDGRHAKIPHYGNVVLEDDVEVGACSTIDRGFLDSTRIGTGSKIDNQVMVAHNCQLGPHNILVSQVGFAGSVTTGAYVICAGQVGVADHVHIADEAVVGAKAGVHKDLSGGETYLGAPAIPESEAIRQVMAARKLPEMRSQLKHLEKQLQKMQQRLDNDQTQKPAA
jgi:UDP-3-O-[3-hydroxymyristoyl] glucosamine N-acyltransferase